MKDFAIALGVVGVFILGLILGSTTQEPDVVHLHYKRMFYTHCLTETNLVQCDSLWDKHIEEVKELSHRGLL